MDPSAADETRISGGITRRQMLTGSLAVLGGMFALPALSGCSSSAQSQGISLKYWHLLSGGDGITMANIVESVNDTKDRKSVV